jgi:hypothetical protein
MNDERLADLEATSTAPAEPRLQSHVTDGCHAS